EVGNLSIPFQRLYFSALDTFQLQTATGTSFLRGHVTLTFDPRDLALDTAGNAIEPLAALFQSSAALPEAELRVILHPEVSLNPSASPGTFLPLPNPEAGAPKIPSGQSRPPVTLRIPLMPVVHTRGALPLPPNSLL